MLSQLSLLCCPLH